LADPGIDILGVTLSCPKLQASLWTNSFDIIPASHPIMGIIGNNRTPCPPEIAARRQPWRKPLGHEFLVTGLTCGCFRCLRCLLSPVRVHSLRRGEGPLCASSDKVQRSKSEGREDLFLAIELIGGLSSLSTKQLKVQGPSERATRKPRLLNRALIWSQRRIAERTSPFSSLLSQAPPRTTRREQSPPVVQADPSVGAPLWSNGVLAQSSIHSQTLPTMSYNPNLLGGNEPTGAVRLPAHWSPQTRQLAIAAPSSVMSSPQG
jgi:hypothetical protein